MTYLLIGIVALVVTFLFDFSLFKYKQQKEVEASWKAVNDKREREGKTRWDKRI